MMALKVAQVSSTGNSIAQTAATTFAFSSVFILLLCHERFLAILLLALFKKTFRALAAAGRYFMKIKKACLGFLRLLLT